MPVWTNWARNQVMEPHRVEHPRSTGEIAAAVKAAAADGRRVKAIGSGHSFSAVGLTDGVLLRLDRCTDVVDVDDTSGQVTVQAGMTLNRLNALLVDHGLSLTNMGDVDAQTVSGAVSTGTHGTGRSSASVAQQITALEIVLADGSVVACSRTERPELFEHARIGLGALGVIAEVTLQAEPLFALHADERPMPLDEVLTDYDELVETNEHFEFFWFPHTDVALTKRNNRADGELAPLSSRRAWFDDVFLANSVLGAFWATGATMPRLVPSLNRLVARLMSGRTYTDVAPNVFVSPRKVRFHETEYAVPRAALGDVVRELRGLPDRLGEKISFPVEVRSAPADDIPLSTAYGRESAYVAVHQYHRTPYARWFAAAERVLQEAGGRPHWGKLHALTHEQLRPLYPRFEDFRDLRRSVDPEGLFRNRYLDTVLGPL